MKMKKEEITEKEKQFQKEALSILSDIKAQIPFTLKNEPIHLELHSPTIVEDVWIEAGMPPDDGVGRVWQTARKLEELGAYKIVSEYSVGIGVKVLQPRFDQLYEEYKETARLMESEEKRTVKSTGKIHLILYSNLHLCHQNDTAKSQCYIFRHRKQSKRLNLVRILANNKAQLSSAEKLGQLIKQKTATVSKEIVALFNAVAQKLNVTPEELYERKNGYRLICDIKIVE